MGELRVVEQVGRSVHCRPRQRPGATLARNLLAGTPPSKGGDDCIDVLPVLPPVHGVLPDLFTQVRGLVGLSHPGQQVAPHPVGAGVATRRVAVRGGKDPVGDMRIDAARATRHHASMDPGDSAGLQSRGDRLLDRHLGQLTGAGPPTGHDREQRGDRGVRARELGRLLARRGSRLVAGVATQPGHAARGSRDGVVGSPSSPRAGEAERGDHHVSDVRPAGWILLAERDRAKVSDRSGLDHNVGVGEETTDHALHLVVADLDRSLAGVPMETRCSARTRTVGTLYPDHVSSGAHEQTPGHQGELVGQVQDAERGDGHRVSKGVGGRAPASHTSAGRPRRRRMDRSSLALSLCGSWVSTAR